MTTEAGKVRRYGLISWEVQMDEMHNGPYVPYTDYVASELRVKELEQQLAELSVDAGRFNQLREWYAAADFRPEEMELGEGVALIFVAPTNLQVGADLGATIDSAKAQEKGNG